MDDVMDLSDYGEEARDILILKLLQDEKSFDHLLQTLERKTTITLLSVKLVITQCRECNGFPSAFIQWINRQCQPFVAYRVQDYPENLQLESPTPLTNGSQSLPSHNITTHGIDNINHSVSMIGTGIVKASSKTKKRVTPNIVSSSVSSTTSSLLQGNIASTPSSEPMGLNSAERGIQNKVILTNTPLTSVDALLNKESLFAAKTVVGVNEILNSSLSSMDLKSTKRGNNSIENMSPNNSSSVGTEASTVSEKFLRETSATKITDIIKRSTPYSIKLTPSSGGDDSSEQSQAVKRMSDLFISLIVNQYISFADAIPLIAKLCSLSLPGPKEGVQVDVVVADSDGFPTLLQSSELFHLFIVRTIKGLLPILNLLGERVALGFAESAVLRRYSPTIASELIGASEDSKSGEVIEDINFSLPDNFIRPFREEIDSRNEYRTQVEAAAYNERERCFDDFSNLLHDFQMINRSDVDGSKILVFWNSVFMASGNKMMDLRDCNYVWFANIFMQMLLFHGLNTVSSSTSGPRLNSNTESSSEEQERRGKGLFKNEIPRDNSKRAHIGTGTVKGDGVALNSKFDLSKQRMLEERMGPGGNGYQNGVRRPAQPNRTNKQQQPLLTASKTMIDLYQDPALHFFGNQQFFFRFIVHMDNHRFCRCLEDVISSEIASLSVEPKAPTSVPLQPRKGRSDSSSIGAGEAVGIAESPSVPSPIRSRPSSFSIDGDDRGESYIEGLSDYSSPGSQSFALRTVKLRILGKFLGLLNFWPQWSLSVSSGESGPLALLATAAAGIRGSLRLAAAAYPLRTILERSWNGGRLAYTVPWIAEFLKMMMWDCTYRHTTNPYMDAFGLLLSIQQSDLLHPVKGKTSSNRLYVLIEIQNLWSALPLNDLRRVSLPTSKENATKRCYVTEANFRVDDHNTAFSRSFLHHVTGFLDESVNAFRKRLRLNLAQRAHVAARNKNTISLSSGSSSVKLMVTKRQTPNLIPSPKTIISTGNPSSRSVPLAESRNTPFLFSSPTSNVLRSSTYSGSQFRNCHTSNDKIEMGSAIETEASVIPVTNLEPRAKIATSLMAQFAAVVAVKPQVLAKAENISLQNGCDDLCDITRTNTKLCENAVRLEPASTSESLKGTVAEVLPDESLNGNSQTLTPNRQNLSSSASTSITASKLNKNRAPFSTSSPDLFRSMQPVVSPMGGLKASTPLSTAASFSSMATPLDSSSLVERLEVAFWQQHPQLQHMSGFLLEQLQKASLAYLRDRVAAAVRLLWSRSAILRTESEKLIRTNIENDLEKECLLLQVNFITSAFASNIEIERDRILTLTATDGKAFLETFIEKHMSVALPELCALHPCHARVTSLSVWLIRKQASVQRGPLMRFLSSYARRKLGEVSSISAKQFKKAMDALIIPFGPLHELKNIEANQNDGNKLLNLKLSTPIIEISVKEKNSPPTNSKRYLKLINQKCRRSEELSSCFIELRLFFAIQDQCVVQTVVDNINKSATEITPVSFNNFMTKRQKFNCFYVQQKVTYHESEYSNFTVCQTINDGLLVAVTFQNKVARICEAVHGLVEVLAACVGDFMEIMDDEILVTKSYSSTASIIKAPSLSPTAPIPTTSWAAIASQKIAGECMSLKDSTLESECEDQNLIDSNTVLSYTDVQTMVWNMRVLMISMIHWAAEEKEKGDLDSKGCSEAAGKLSIQIVKMMTLCLPSLVYMDYFLSQELNQSEIPNRTSNPFCPCTTECSCSHLNGNKDIMDWDKFISWGDRSALINLGYQYPSDTLILAEALNLISKDSLTFIIIASARASTLAYYTSCKNLPSLKKKVPAMLISLIGRYYLHSYHTFNRGYEINHNLSNHEDLSIGTKLIFDGLCLNNSKWYKDPSSQSAIRIYLNPEILNIIVKLSK